jgi:hypothetical protein
VLKLYHNKFQNTFVSLVCILRLHLSSVLLKQKILKVKFVFNYTHKTIVLFCVLKLKHFKAPVKRGWELTRVGNRTLLRVTFHALDNKHLMFQLCFNSNRIHDNVGKALRTANQGHVTANSHYMHSDSRLIRAYCKSVCRTYYLKPKTEAR